MSSQLEQQAAKAMIAMSGLEGTKGIFPVVANRITASTNMKNGTYTIAAQPIAPSLLSVLVTGVGTVDTMGTVTIVGTDINGTAISEVVTPIAGTTVYTTKEFNSVTSATGAGWVIDGGAANDLIVIGVADVIAPTGYYFSSIQFVTASVVSTQTNLPGAIVAQFNDFTSIPVGTYPTKITKIALTSGSAIGTLAKI